MTEYKKDRPTSEQLVDLLDNKLEITVCADVVYGLDYEYKQLQQENKQLQQEKNQLDEAITICDILVKSNVEENIRLRKTIDKTIEYIEYNLKSFLYSVEYKTLLSILKGEKQ